MYCSSSRSRFHQGKYLAWKSFRVNHTKASFPGTYFVQILTKAQLPQGSCSPFTIGRGWSPHPILLFETRSECVLNQHSLWLIFRLEFLWLNSKILSKHTTVCFFDCLVREKSAWYFHLQMLIFFTKLAKEVLFVLKPLCCSTGHCSHVSVHLWRRTPWKEQRSMHACKLPAPWLSIRKDWKP